MGDLRLKPDKAALEDLISQAQGLDAANYEEASYQAMLSVLADVQAVYDDSEAEQEEIDGAVTALQAALDQLVLNPDDTQEPDDTQNPDDSQDTGSAQTPSDTQNTDDTKDAADTAQSNSGESAQTGAGTVKKAENTGASVPLRYNNDKQKKPLFSRGLSVCRLLFNSFSKLKIDENYKEKRRLFY